MAIAEYDLRWPPLYESAAVELERALAPWLVAIEHSADIVEAFETLGYEYVPEYETRFCDRRYFWKLAPTGQRSHQVHLVERSNLGWWERHIAFRDWLRTHSQVRDRYELLKRQLAVEFEHGRAGYTDSKSSFVLEIEGRA